MTETAAASLADRAAVTRILPAGECREKRPDVHVTGAVGVDGNDGRGSDVLR